MPYQYFSLAPSPSWSLRLIFRFMRFVYSFRAVSSSQMVPHGRRTALYLANSFLLHLHLGQRPQQTSQKNFTILTWIAVRVSFHLPVHFISVRKDKAKWLPLCTIFCPKQIKKIILLHCYAHSIPRTGGKKAEKDISLITVYCMWFRNESAKWSGAVIVICLYIVCMNNNCVFLSPLHVSLQSQTNRSYTFYGVSLAFVSVFAYSIASCFFLVYEVRAPRSRYGRGPS